MPEPITVTTKSPGFLASATTSTIFPTVVWPRFDDLTPGGRIAVVMTACRIPLSSLIWFWLATDQRFYAAALLALLMLVDVFDGFIFRASLEGTAQPFDRAHRIFDAFADRWLIFGCALAAQSSGAVPTFLIIAIVAREAIVTAIGVWRFSNGAGVLRPNLPSRLAMVIGGILVIGSLFDVIPTASIVVVHGLVGVIGIALHIWRPRYE